MIRVACSFPFGGASLPAVLIVRKDGPDVVFVSVDIPDLGTAAQRPAVRKLIIDWGLGYAASNVAELKKAAAK